ncbi:hypothetical protein [Actinomadura violacea]|uniref:Uncharacterized protein n=1 Tax=Actinomadura violacea TaxID=2819934 RepID=A0ABS3RQW2_9ACTN|nr:hypothetical protein [Actinomadura violacea]MBO2459136.1 hypothetical protein [Actinomadura violacea]
MPAGPPPPPAPPGTGAPLATVLGLRARQWMVVAIVVGCVYLVSGTIAIVGAWGELHRDPTNAELEWAAKAEVARRWQAWPAERIFPSKITYSPAEGRTEYASRTGIVPDTNCATGVDQELAQPLIQQGCKAVLRATYTDRLQGIAVTVGVVVFADPWAADRAFKTIPGSHGATGGSVRPALRAAPFPGTASARFTDAARQDRTSGRGGPYVVLTTSGETDGRPAAAVRKERPGEPFAIAPQLGDTIARTLSAKALPDCHESGWKC